MVLDRLSKTSDNLWLRWSALFHDPLVIVARETPLNLIHLKNMQAVTEAGAVVMPFTPAFYTRDTSFEAMMRHFTGRLLDQFRIEHHLCKRWRDDR